MFLINFNPSSETAENLKNTAPLPIRRDYDASDYEA